MASHTNLWLLGEEAKLLCPDRIHFFTDTRLRVLTLIPIHVKRTGIVLK